MSAPQFTPGPWEAGKETGYGQLNGIRITETGQGFVAAVVIADVPELYSKRRANANLIAAAPELYSALASVVAVVRPKVLEQSMNLKGETLLDVATSALAKARGEQ